MVTPTTTVARMLYVDALLLQGKRHALCATILYASSTHEIFYFHWRMVSKTREFNLKINILRRSYLATQKQS